MPSEFDSSDKIFEWVMILLGILQASLFQFLTWFTPISYETLTQTLPNVLDLLMKITTPFVFCIVIWIYSITRVDEYSRIRYRVISWGVVTTIFFFLLNALNHIIFRNVFRLTSLGGIFFQIALYMEVVLLPLTVSTLAVQKIKSVYPENTYWMGSRNLVDNIIIGLIGSLIVLYVLEQVLIVVK